MNRNKFTKAFISAFKEMLFVFILTIAVCIIAAFSDVVTGTVAYGVTLITLIIFAANLYLEYKDLKDRED